MQYRYRATQFNFSIDGSCEAFYPIRGRPLANPLATRTENFSNNQSILPLIQGCAKLKDLQKGIQLHANIRATGLLGKDCYVASNLVSMYAKCGAFAKAVQILDELPFRDVVSWNALIAGYTQEGQAEEAFKCFKAMQLDGLSPNAVTFICILNACARIQAIDKGRDFHEAIVRHGLLHKDIVVGNCLVDMYIKCSALAKAVCVVDELPLRDVISWNSLIFGYGQQGLVDEALHCVEMIQNEGLCPNAITFTLLLKAYGNVGAINEVTRMHAEIKRHGLLEEKGVLANTLIDMYVKCGALDKAVAVLNMLPAPDVVSWNTLIDGYVQQGCSEEALSCYVQMQQEGLFPNAVTFICILKACSSIGALDKGERIHEQILIWGLLGKDSMLGGTLVDMYARCGAVVKAVRVFEEIPLRNVVSWTALISAYARQGQGVEALECFDQMQREGIFPDIVILTSILKICGSMRATEKGEHIHSKILERGLLGKDIVLGGALVDMYAKCGALARAAEVFDELVARDLVTWNALIAGYAEFGRGQEALKCYERMCQEGFSPNNVTFMSILKACSSIGAIDKGNDIHGQISRQGLLRRDASLGVSLVDMYVKCGVLLKAVEVLDELPVRSVEGWNVLIAGYAYEGLGMDAVNCFRCMLSEGFCPDRVTFICILKACGCTEATGEGEEIHEEIARQGLLGKDTVLANSLADMYAKCGAISKAEAILYKFPLVDVVSWNVLIAGYVQQGQSEEALHCFEQMQREGYCPDAVTFISTMKACSSIGAADQGENIHCKIVRQGLLDQNMELANTLVDMYAKCGVLSKAVKVLEELPVRNVVSWSALIAGYAQQGQFEEALKCLEHMRFEDLSPNSVTWTCLLNACCRSHLVNKGQMYFTTMSAKHGIMPSVEQYTCIVDLFCRSGDLKLVFVTLEKMPSLHYLPVWHSVLGACQKYGNVHLGRLAFEKAIQIDENDCSAYILMASIYAAAGMHEDATRFEVAHMSLLKKFNFVRDTLLPTD